MTERNTITILRQCVDMLEDELEGQPLCIDRPGKDDFILVTEAVYSRLLSRIYELEEATKTDEEREAEQKMLLRKLSDAMDESSGTEH